MFKKILRKIRANPLERLIYTAKSEGKKKILIEWNRGLGDIALGLYAMVHRIYQFIPDAKITFITRPSLKDGFSLLQGVETIIYPQWKRHHPYDAQEALHSLGIDVENFEVIIKKPDPTHWVKWQLGKITPKLSWSTQYDVLYKKFPIDLTKKTIAIQPSIESDYKLWRSWNLQRWQEFIDQLQKKDKVNVLLVGQRAGSTFQGRNILDLRGKTNLFELLSILKNACTHCILPDSGILSTIYYLDCSFPLKVISLWGDTHQGVLKQNVKSPNPLLIHYPIIGEHKNLDSIYFEEIFEKLFIDSHLDSKKTVDV